MRANTMKQLYLQSDASRCAAGRKIDFFFYNREFSIRYTYPSDSGWIRFETAHALDNVPEQIRKSVDDIEVYYKIEKYGPTTDKWYFQIDKLVLRKHPRKNKHVVLKGED
jgi:hypothetical protein